MHMFRCLLLGCLLFLPDCRTAIAETGSDGTLRGIARAMREASISTDLFFRITRVPFREGQTFNKGDLLLTFDCTELETELKAAAARRRAEQLTYDNNKRLAKLNAAGAYEVEMQYAKLQQANAELESLETKLGGCSLYAPFDGSIANLNVNEHEFPGKQLPLMRIVDRKSLEIEALLPSAWLQWLKPGTKFDILIEEINLIHPAEVVRILPMVDPVSQTIEIVGRFTTSTDSVLPGMSGPVMFKKPDD